MIEYIKDLIEKIKNGMLKEMYIEGKWIAKYIYKYKWGVVFYIFLGILGTILGLISSVFSKNLIDAVTGHDSENIGVIIATIIGMGLGSIILEAVTGRISAKINIKVGNEIRADIYDKIINTDWESMSSFHSGDLLTRLTGDATTVADSVLGWIPNLITKLVQFICIFAVIMYYDPTMAVLSLLSAPITILVSKSLMLKMRKFNKASREISSEMMAFNEETFQNLQSIKAFNLINVFSNRLRGVQEKAKKVGLEYNKFSIYTYCFMSVVGMIVYYSCFGWGVYRLWTGHITYGTMTLFLQLSSKLSSSFSDLINVVPSAIGATTAAGRIMEVVELPRENIKDDSIVDTMCTNLDDNGISVKVEDGYFKYLNSEKVVLDNANIEANPSEIIALVGPSGEGKSTMMRILLGLTNLKSGKATLKDESGLNCHISASSRKLMAYVPQEKTMFSGTIAENMRMVKGDATDEEIINALKDACAYDFVEKLPEGIYSSIGERGLGFSEGQNQRLSIARALLRNSPILLLDEATSALDVDTERRVLKNIMDSNKKRTCIVTTHRPSVLNMCNRVYRIYQSRVNLVEQDEVEKMAVDF
ncbi:MAG: ABC transporter ATP-binding protein [Romboutsia timonensis]|uniref:ABC transporter ATP-binding protein n=1 Tax=Romboutsia timonensis TaxID=1776391 RepID=UPI002A75DD28|nr:ABC transporter ATP-binding protein [Romboutsia timonensis]MDY3002546.1 ABC transporter ATP-binding protein [Romboutsia timonensis]